jgi:hypothetical protein
MDPLTFWGSVAAMTFGIPMLSYFYAYSIKDYEVTNWTRQHNGTTASGVKSRRHGSRGANRNLKRSKRRRL